MSARKAAGALLAEVLRHPRPEGHLPQHLFARNLQIELLHDLERDPRAAEREARETVRRYPEHDVEVPRLWLNLLILLNGRAPPGEAAQAREELRRGRADAWKSGNWYVYRLYDFHEAAVLQDEALAQRVHFGSSYAGLRALLARRLGGALKLPDSLDWRLGPEGRGRATRREELPILEAGALGEGRPAALARALSADLYRPISEAELDEGVHPGADFDPRLSSLRARVALHRLRAWLRKSRLPHRIEALGGAYRWSAQAPCLLRLGNPDNGRAAADPLDLAALRALQRFDAAQAAQSWGIPLRTAQARLSLAVEQGRVVRQGRARATQYLIAQKT